MKVIERTWWRLLSEPDECYWAYLMKVIERTWWRLLSEPDESYWAYLIKVIERTWWRLLSVPNKGYWAYLMKVILNIPDKGYWAYLMKVILSVPDEGDWAYLMKVIERTWWTLFQIRVVRTKFDIYIFIVTRWVPLVEQELAILSEYLNSCYRIAQSFVFCILFCRSLFVLLSCSFGHCIVCPFIYRFWLPIWYL